MFYKFPLLETIQEVLDVIKDKKEFIVVNKESYTVINYVVASKETFPPVLNNDINAAILRECRGLIFYPSGQLMSRPFHKFFNVGEKDETNPEAIDMSNEHIVLEKLDGSMIRPLYIDGEVKWATKMGTTDVAAMVETFISSRPSYNRLALMCKEKHLTPLFEFCSRLNRIVLDYPTTRLVLTAVRHIHTGNYMLYDEMVALANEYEIDVVNAKSSSSSDMVEFLTSVRAEDDNEGYVIRFQEQGHMVKVKTEWYVGLHKGKDKLSSERELVSMVLGERLDDVKPLLSKEDRLRLDDFESSILAGLRVTQERLYHKYLECQLLDAKAFAQSITPTLAKGESNILFTLRGKVKNASLEDCWHVLVDHIMKNLSSNKRMEDVRWLWGGCKWSAPFVETDE